jgi:hypothetical protein
MEQPEKRTGEANYLRDAGGGRAPRWITKPQLLIFEVHDTRLVVLIVFKDSRGNVGAPKYLQKRKGKS